MATSGFGCLRRGQVVSGRYRVEHLVGRGGMSQVVCATDLAHDRKVALKVPHAERARSPKDVARMLREARANGRLASPHAARLLDTGTFRDEGVEIPYLVLEYVDGVDLATWLRATGRVDAITAATIIFQACDAIGEAHTIGLVHRDVKPANLMLSASPTGELIAKVLDFGIAREYASDDPRLTGTGELLGSPTYMAPEQLRPSTAVDARADVWALGIVLFEALAGRLPFASTSLPELCLEVLLDDPQPLPDDCPAELAAIVRRCLAKEPGARYASAHELAEALRPLVARSLPISATDLELAAIDAAARDHVPSSDRLHVEASRGRERSRRWWWRTGAVAAVLALGVVIEGSTSGPGPHEMAAERPVAAPRQPDAPSTPAPAVPAIPPLVRPTAVTAAPNSESIAAVPDRRANTPARRATSARRAPKRPPVAPPAVTASPASAPTPPPARARDPLASPF